MLLGVDKYTVKYVYGPATVDASRDGVIGSSIAGRIETSIGIDRLTTIAMSMKGSSSLQLSLHTLLIFYFFTSKGVEPVLRTRVSKGTQITATTEAQTNVKKNQYKYQIL